MDLHLLPTFDMMIEIDMPRKDHEPGAGHRTDQIVEETVTDEGDSQEEMIDIIVEMKTADPILTEMGTTVGRERTCQ